MNDASNILDEYDLAAFLAGTLPESRRQEVVAYLASNAEARELLCMAHEALEMSQKPEVYTPPPQGAPARAPRKAVPRQRTFRFGRYLAAAVVVFSLGFGLRLALGPPDDALRSQQEATQDKLTVEIATPDLAFEWTPIPSAYRYTIVVWDAYEARVVAQHETRTTSISHHSEFVETLRPLLRSNRDYTLRVDAIDARNRLLKSSDLTNFSL